MADYSEAKAMDREPSLRDRVTRLEKTMSVLQETVEEINAQLRRLTREVGIDEPT